MDVIGTERVPIKMWVTDIEDSALSQAKNIANLPFAYHHVAIMPDAHAGYGMPVGGVFAAENVVVPNAVGVDIGCGMCAVRTNLKDNNGIGYYVDSLKTILGEIRKAIPVGFDHHDIAQEWSGFDVAPNIPIIQQELNSARKQLGTLGGGNHFIEIQHGSDGYIWIMIHSGSRNIGYKIAKEYNKIASNLCSLWYSSVDTINGQDGLAFLPIGTKEASDYINAMNFALEFAFENRQHMMRKICEIFYNVVNATPEEEHNIHHNYAKLENHFNKNVWVHRKGATSARLGEYGIIPGSQGTKSYIVKGLGNKDSFTSCSHGAGRLMSRTKARETLILEDEINLLDSKGILHSIRGKSDLDEASSAYKDISVVMNNQKDLVEIAVELTPLAVVKG